MSSGDTKFKLSEFWNEFKKEKSGIVGLVILLLCLLVVIFEPLILPWKEANSKWRDINYWQDNPASAPPEWTNVFSKQKAPVTQRITKGKREEVELEGGAKMVTYTLDYNYTADKAPLDVIFHISGTGDIPLTVSIERPDGLQVELFQRFEQGLSNQDIRISVDNDGREAAFAFIKQYESELALEDYSSTSLRTGDILFSIAQTGMAKEFKPLKGTYKLIAQAMILDPANMDISDPYVVVTGSVSGILGTDDSKRDLASGLIAGMKWALMIGFLTSIVSVLIGVLYGIISAYFGGKVDSVMMFIYQIVNSIPVLPVLIVISAIFKPNIYTLILVMIIFFWTGSVMTVRSMALQIKEETYIEAAKALGATNRRIIFRHMVPLLIPYSFASMALSVPSAIVYESSVSLLGLGDATIVTWGQILHDAMQGAAVLKGLWWWVIPPGLAIAAMGMTFAFIGFSMDKILHPKLQTR
ncbi:MAG: ABC transporter permease [Spirochaetaceae bacterium]|nr:ABC transporter permease [Spirochaetaceae bacterium]